MVRSTTYPASPMAMVASVVANRSLIATLVRREISGRYRGSALGIVWSVLTPVMMLAVYTYVFSKVFKQRVEGGPGSWADFALVLFAALVVFNMFASCVTRAPSMILSNANFVKKVVFPLEVLPVVALLGALFDLVLSIGVWVLLYVVALGVPQISMLWLPLTLLPALLLALGATWLLAALGVYVRDVAQFVGILVMVLMFMSPIFYRISSITDEAMLACLYVNPLTVSIEQTRGVMFWGRAPDAVHLGIALAACALFCWLGFAFFQKTRRGFADVL